MTDKLNPTILERGPPACFNSLEEWTAWRELALFIKPGSCAKHPWCADCTPKYQARMIRAGRCAFPGVGFGVDGDGFVCGKCTHPQCIGKGKYIRRKKASQQLELIK